MTPIPENRYRAMSKTELAEAAEVSIDTLRKWISDCEELIIPLLYRRNDKILNPAVVKFLCEKYVIFLRH